MHESDLQARYEELIQHLGRSLGIAELSPDENGICALVGDDQLTLELELEKDGVLFSAIVARISDSLVSDWAIRLLEANAYWVGTGGATLGLFSATGSVVQCYRHTLEGLDDDQFVRLFNAFCNGAEEWSRRLRESPVPAEEPADMMHLMGQRV